MNARTYIIVSAVVFALVAVGHLARSVLGWPVVIGSWSAPMALSWAVLIFTGALAIMGYRLATGQQPGA